MTTTLANLTLAALTTVYNDAIEAYGAPAGMNSVTGFKSKSVAIDRIGRLCDHGNLAVEFDGDTAVIIDATPVAGEGDASEGDASEGDAGEGDASEGDTSEGGEAIAAQKHGDRKGAKHPSGFTCASREWLAAHPRGTEIREAYRKERKAWASAARKAAKAAKAETVTAE